MSGLPNWIDLIVIIAVWRYGYVGLGHGVWAELLSFIFTVAVTAVTVNYWGLVDSFFRPYMGTMPQVDFVLFLVVLLIVTLAVSVSLRRLLSVFQTQTHDWFYYGMGMLVGVARGVWLAGFIILILTGSGWPYANESIDKASFGARVEGTVVRALAVACHWLPGYTSNPEQYVPSAYN